MVKYASNHGRSHHALSIFFHLHPQRLTRLAIPQSIMSLLQLLYLFYKRFFPDPTPAAPTPPILELPDELVLCIANHLAPYDQFLLSRTCRTMRRLLSRDWNAYLRSRTPSERNEFLVAVAFGMPNHWACENCGQLHGIDLRDLPSKKTLPHCVQPTNNGARSWAGYNLEYHHIQLALKLSDRGINEDYLQSLLSARRFTSYRSEMTISYTARPRIAQGHFLLYERAVFGDGYCRATYSSIQQSWISICPHLAMMQSPLDYRRMLAWLHQTAELYRAVSQAIQDPSHEVRRHCRWCATDYSLLYHQHTGQLILSAWHDFGAYGSVSSPHWSSQALRQNDDAYPLAAPFSRMPGASRQAYMYKSKRL
ncbi:hypothetical protein HDV64DRAFT_117204 [Trichoderma sp. TUCIM 5745]